ncbi:MAG TPA: response regulator [Phycisphaerales bacterium]|nr:response regulator [Phycisphaerales bacterium]
MAVQEKRADIQGTTGDSFIALGATCAGVIAACAGAAVGALQLIGTQSGVAGAALSLCGLGMAMFGAHGVAHAKAKRLHAQLREATSASEELQKVSASRTKLLDATSHDLRTPLQAILGFADVLRDADTNAQTREQSVDAMTRNARRLLGTIDQIHEITALSAGTWKAKAGSLRGCLQQVVSQISNESERKVEVRVVCVNDIPNASGEHVYAMMCGVAHALRHAAQHASDGKLLVTLTYVPDRQLVSMTIEHKGHTAPHQIVDLLVQHDDAMRFLAERPAGSGCLGLALAKQHLRAHGGSIIAKLRDDSSTIIIDFPASASVQAGTFSDVPVEEARASNAINTREVRVLVVDDAEDTLRLVKHHLTKAGYRVEACTTGREGLERALAAKRADDAFAVMLLDMNLPDMDGASVASMLRQEGYRGTIVAFTATAVAESLDTYVKAGCDSWLTKPIDRAKLLDAVKRTAVRDAERRLAA